MRTLVIVLVVLLTIVTGVASAQVPHYYWDETDTRATYMFRYGFVGTGALQGGIRHDFDTWDLTEGADTMMYLLPVTNGDCDWSAQVKYNDDCPYPGEGQSPYRSCFSYRPSTTGEYCLIVHAYDPEGGGSGGHAFDAYHNAAGQPEEHLGRYDLGGYRIWRDVDPADTFETVLVNDGAEQTLLVRQVMDAYGVFRMEERAFWNSIGGSSVLYGGAGSAVEAWIVATPYTWTVQGPVRAVRDDKAYQDTDKDELGDSLEQELCTCASPNATPCGRDCAEGMPDSKDTDGDGIRDDLEVRGTTEWLPDWTTGDNDANPQYLPWWGADPLHKDVFIEIDYWDDPTRLTQPDVDWVALRYGSLPDQNNPDGLPGLALHVDIGQACANDPGDNDGVSATCGDFGGSTVLTHNQGCVDPGAERIDLRRHLFHWGELYDGPGGGYGYGDTFCWGDGLLRHNFAHELGHNFGLDHSGGFADAGAANYKPNYPSLMNYAYDTSLNGSSETWFSDGSRATTPLFPRSLKEQQTYTHGTDIAFMCEPNGAPFLYSCQNGSVDWNRDGDFSSVVNVRANIGPGPGATQALGTDQDLGHLSGREPIGGLAPQVGLASAVLTHPYFGLEVTVVVANNPSTHRFVYNWSLQVEGGWQFSSWPSLRTEVLGEDSEPAAAVYRVGTSDKMFVFGATPAGTIKYVTIDTNGTVGSWSPPLTGQPPGVTFKDVSAAVYTHPTGMQYLSIVGRNNTAGSGLGEVYHGYLTPTLGWVGWYKVISSATPVVSADVTPGLASGPEGNLYMLTKVPASDPDPDRRGHLRLYVWNGLLWTIPSDDNMNMWRDDSGDAQVASRPAVAFRYHRDTSGNRLPSEKGALWIWYSVGSAPGYIGGRYRSTWGPFSDTEADFGGALTMGKWVYACDFPGDGIQGGVAVADRSDSLTTFFVANDVVEHLPYGDGQGVLQHPHNDYRDSVRIADRVCWSLNAYCTDPAARCADLNSPCEQEDGGDARSGPSEMPEGLWCSPPDLGEGD